MTVHIKRIAAILVLMLSVVTIPKIDLSDTPPSPSSTVPVPTTDTPEPYLTLYKDNATNNILIFQNGTIQLINPDNPDGTILLQLETDDIYYWHNDSTLLLGTPLELTATQGHPGAWYSFDLASLDTTLHNPIQLAEFHADPRKIISVTIAMDPGLYFIVEDHPNGYHMEYWYNPATEQLYPALYQPSAGSNDQQYSEQYEHNRPMKVVEEQYFQQESRYSLSDGSNIYTYVDDRGTLVYYDSGEASFALRYMDQQVADVRSMTDLKGNTHPILLIKDTEKYLSFPTKSYETYLRDLPELIDEQWRMIDLYNFYKLTTDRLELIQYEPHNERDYHEFNRFANDLPISLADAGEGLLQQVSTNGEHSLSLYDLLDHHTAFEDIWIRDLPAPITLVDEGARFEEWNRYNEQTLPSGIIELLKDGPPLPQEIEEARNNSEDGCVLGCKGLDRDAKWRNIDGVWYILADQMLFQVKEQQLVEVGKLPISTTAHVWGDYTALDFTKYGQNWYVADTYGNRVIKLNEQLEVVAEHALPLPSTIKVDENGAIVTTSLAGITVMNNSDLSPVQNKASTPVNLASFGQTDMLFPKVSHYTDAQLKLHWVYIYNGEVVLYDEGRKQYRTLFVGYPHNGSSMVKIMPYHNDVLVMLDHQLHRFTREGKWKNTIEYPRSYSIVERFYNQTPEGENSFVLDEQAGVIYLVQGYRVLRIDLELAAAHPLFVQLNSNIGAISLYKDHLFFTMEGHPVWHSEERSLYSNELVVIPTRSGKPQRYLLESGWVSNGFVEQGAKSESGLLSLWRIAAPAQTGYPHKDEFATLYLDAFVVRANH